MRRIVRETGRRFGAPLASRAFRRLVAGKAVSYLGDWVTIAALVGWIYHRTGSTGSVAALMVVRLLPPVVGGGLTASLLDRVPRERALVVGQLASAGAAAAALVGVLRGSELEVLAAAAVLGLVSPVGYSAAGALVPQVVPEEHLTQANAILAIAQELAMAGGALLAGLMLTAGGAAWPLAGALASYLAATVCSARIRPSVPARSAAKPRTAASGLLASLGYLRGRQTLLLVLGAFALSTLATGLTNASLPRFLGGLGLGQGAYGLGIAALAAGFVAGEAAAGLAGPRVGPRWFGWATGAMAPLFVALALAPDAAAALLALLAIGCADGVAEVVLPTVVQRDAAPEYHGRVFALASTAIRTTMLGAVAAAPLVNRLGPPRDAILASAAVLAAAGVAVLAGGSVRHAATRARALVQAA